MRKKASPITILTPNNKLDHVLRARDISWFDSFDLHVRAGKEALRLGRLRDATNLFWDAVALRPSHLGACGGLVCAAEATGDAQEASAAWVALGSTLFDRMQYAEAERAYHRAIAHRPRCLPALRGLGLTYLAVGDAPRAIRHLEAALAIAPDHTQIHVYLGYAHHLAGDTDRGWDQFAWQYRSAGRRHHHEQPLWDGLPLNGQRILLWTEQGHGDTIQFLRYVAFVSESGGRVIVECHHAGLLRLIHRMPGVERVVPFGAPLPPFDFHAPLMYFPALYAHSRVSNPNQVGYLSVDERLSAKWRQRLGRTSDLMVGLSWAGNQAHPGANSRFAPLDAFAPLSRVAGVRLLSLQYGARGNDIHRVSRDLRVEQLFGNDFPIEDAAALIANLDLVISVDTMIAHLAGALGKPIWTILRQAANWRWQLKGSATSWYPTMRLFRQTRGGVWADVFEGVRDALAELRMHSQGLELR